MRARYGLGLAALAAVLLGTLTGCATLQAVDTTRALEAITAGEHQVTYTRLPGDLAPGGALAGKDIWIPTVPGKDIHVTAWYPDGAKYLEVDSQRSPVIDTLLARAAGIDAEKFAADANLRAWVSQERAAYMDLLAPAMNAWVTRLNTPAATQPSTRERLSDYLDLLTDPRAQQVIDALKKPAPN